MERLGACRENYLFGTSRIATVAYESVLVNEHSAFHCLEIQVVESLAGCRTLGERICGNGEEEMFSVRCDVVERDGMIGVGQRLHHPRGEVKARDGISGSPVGLSVIGM